MPFSLNFTGITWAALVGQVLNGVTLTTLLPPQVQIAHELT